VRFAVEVVALDEAACGDDVARRQQPQRSQCRRCRHRCDGLAGRRDEQKQRPATKQQRRRQQHERCVFRRRRLVVAVSKDRIRFEQEQTIVGTSLSDFHLSPFQTFHSFLMFQRFFRANVPPTTFWPRVVYQTTISVENTMPRALSIIGWVSVVCASFFFACAPQHATRRPAIVSYRRALISTSKWPTTR
jgi:hypothetical protein